MAPCTSTRCFADTPSWDQLDLYGSYKVSDMLSVRMGIDNLARQGPAGGARHSG